MRLRQLRIHEPYENSVKNVEKVKIPTYFRSRRWKLTGYHDFLWILGHWSKTRYFFFWPLGGTRMSNILKIVCMVIKKHEFFRNNMSRAYRCICLPKKSFWKLISNNTENSLYDYPIWLTHTYLKSAKFFLSYDICHHTILLKYHLGYFRTYRKILFGLVLWLIRW